MEALAKFVLGITVFALFATGGALLMAYPVMWFVNDLFTPNVLIAVFGVAQLGFWKAFSLNILCGLLFKSSSSSSSSKE